MSTQGECSSQGCSKLASKLACPKCIKMGLPPTYFCGQECFRNNYTSHNQIHKLAQQILDSNKNSSIHRKTPPDGSSCDPTEPAATRLSLPKWATNCSFTGDLLPALISPKRTVPSSIRRPDYAVSSLYHVTKAYLLCYITIIFSLSSFYFLVAIYQKNDR